MADKVTQSTIIDGNSSNSDIRQPDKLSKMQPEQHFTNENENKKIDIPEKKDSLEQGKALNTLNDKIEEIAKRNASEHKNTSEVHAAVRTKKQKAAGLKFSI